MADIARMQVEHIRKLRTELNRLVTELVELGAQLIVLFGSAARGELDLFSDIDLFVVLETDLPFIERTVWLYEQLHPEAADIICYTPSEFAQLKDKKPFLKHILSEGVVLHGTVS